jgi:hypothetical protein
MKKKETERNARLTYRALTFVNNRGSAGVRTGFVADLIICSGKKKKFPTTLA